MMAALQSRKTRQVLSRSAAAVLFLAAGWTMSARAEDAPEAAADAPASSAAGCETDIGKLQAKRNAQIASLNQLSKKGGKLDPVAACPKLRGLASIEQQMLGYMVKNQNWCNIPENVIENVKEGSGKTATIAKQACGLAAQVKKMQSQQAAGGGGSPFGGQPAAPKLPAGPL
ncbi:MAG: hypothetical protein JWM36_3539 [Hyphomicrobiales bacterium]|nr:hypothetical protein [Hyphomicrobiales bacterium]